MPGEDDDAIFRITWTPPEGDRRPPEDIPSYSGSYTPLPDDEDDDPTPERQPAESERCVVCGDPNWAWTFVMAAVPPRSPIAWQQYLAACDTCVMLYRHRDHEGLKRRVADGDGTDWLLEHFEPVVRAIKVVRRRQRIID
jgi:hypothetical protein